MNSPILTRMAAARSTPTSSTSGSAHTLTTSLVVGPSGNANNPLTVTHTNDASMTAGAPAACENTYFSMPSLTGVAAVLPLGCGVVTVSRLPWAS